MIHSVLTVCVGNICRSPMAEALLRSSIEKTGLPTNVSSAGIGALVDNPADPLAQQLMEERGIDISGHRARQIDETILSDAELLLVMENEHKEYIERAFPVARGRVFLIGHWQDKFEIPDPYKQPRAAFEFALSLIEKGIDDWMRVLSET